MTNTFKIPKLGSNLSKEHLEFLEAFSLNCRRTIIEMTKQSQSGHPGGSLSSIDYLSLLYAFIIGQTGDKVVVSNGHVSPAVYSTLAEMGWIPKQDVIDTFRQVGSIYEGHVTRHVPGVWYGTGPLGIGFSVASGFASAAKLTKSNEHIYCMIGDGEAQEGIVYETMHFANKYKLNNLTVFVDYNEVQLSSSLEEIMPINLRKIFESADWNVIEVDGHNYQKLWSALQKSHEEKSKPTIIIGKTIMGKGVEFMEGEGREKRPTWHGKAASPEDSDKILEDLVLTNEQETLLNEFRKSQVTWSSEKPFAAEYKEITIDTGKPTVLKSGTVSDCRSAYGKALLDIAQKNDQIVALTADLGGSVMTKFMAAEFPHRVLDVGIAEQHMVSCAGGLSLSGLIPFASTFGAFLTSRPKDQVRVNDINRTNVKMVATHCGLSVGEDGPTHQAIDDMGSLLGLFNTTILEPADANQCDHIIRHIASVWGNFYVRMGRHKYEVLTKEDGTPFYDENYVFKPGKADIIRSGSDITVLMAGSMCDNTMKAYNEIKGDISIELIALSSLKPLDEETIINSATKTGKVLTIEDHNIATGYGNAVASMLARHGVSAKIKSMGVTEYQLSGKSAELYDEAGLGTENVREKIQSM